MDPVLSKDEVNALMSALAEDGTADDVPSGDEVVSYDLTSQDRIVRGRLPGLDSIHEHAGRVFGRKLTLMLGTSVVVRTEVGALLKHGELGALIPSPAKIAVLRLSPFPGSAILSIDPVLNDRLMAVMLGGAVMNEPGTALESMREEITPITERLLRRLFSSFTTFLSEAWSEIEPVDIEIDRIEFEPDQAAVGVSSDLVVATSFDVEIEGEPSGRFLLGIPFTTLEPVRQRLGDTTLNAGDKSDPLARKALMHVARSLPIQFCCELGQAHMTMREFLRMSCGDVIRLDRSPENALSCSLEGRPRMWGKPFVSAGNMALEITDRSRETGSQDG